MPATAGIVERAAPAVAVLILPKADAPGTLETLCLNSVVADPAIQCVDGFLQCLEQTAAVPRNRDKAKRHAFLASREKPDLQLGEAASAGYFSWDHPAFDQVKQFIQAVTRTAE